MPWGGDGCRHITSYIKMDMVDYKRIAEVS